MAGSSSTSTIGIAGDDAAAAGVGVDSGGGEADMGDERTERNTRGGEEGQRARNDRGRKGGGKRNDDTRKILCVCFSVYACVVFCRLCVLSCVCVCVWCSVSFSFLISFSSSFFLFGTGPTPLAIDSDTNNNSKYTDKETVTDTTGSRANQDEPVPTSGERAVTDTDH